MQIEVQELAPPSFGTSHRVRLEELIRLSLRELLCWVTKIKFVFLIAPAGHRLTVPCLHYELNGRARLPKLRTGEIAFLFVFKALVFMLSPYTEVPRRKFLLFCRTRWFGPLLNFLTDSALFTLRKDEAVCKTYSRGLEETHGAWHMTTAACVREAGVKTFACATTSTPAPRSTASKSADGFLILHPSPVSFGRGRAGAAAHQIGQTSNSR